MMYTTETAEKVARDASPEASMWILELAKQRDVARRDYECMNRFREGAELDRDKLREALQELLIASLDDRLSDNDGVVQDARRALNETEGL